MVTDPKDAKKWPEGLRKLLEKHGAKGLVELMRKQIKPKEEKPRVKVRLPYAEDVDSSDEPD